ncbi:MAG: SDR family NAD(P)-dependent oxidoreductase [Planctomycetota bacterium]
MQHLLVTGASSGIGAALVRLACARGWQVTAVARRGVELAALGEELGTDRLVWAVADVTDEASVAVAVAQGVARFGPFTAVVAKCHQACARCLCGVPAHGVGG